MSECKRIPDDFVENEPGVLTCVGRWSQTWEDCFDAETMGLARIMAGRCCPQCIGEDRRENASRPAGARGLRDDGRRRHRCYASTSGGRRANHGREAGHAACRDSSLYGLCLPRRDLRSLQASARGGRAAIRRYVLGHRRTQRPAHASLHSANSRRCKPRTKVNTLTLQEIKIRAIGAAV